MRCVNVAQCTMSLHPSSPGPCYGAAVLHSQQARRLSVWYVLCTFVDLSMGVRMARFGVWVGCAT